MQYQGDCSSTRCCPGYVCASLNAYRCDYCILEWNQCVDNSDCYSGYCYGGGNSQYPGICINQTCRDPGFSCGDGGTCCPGTTCDAATSTCLVSPGFDCGGGPGGCANGYVCEDGVCVSSQ
jgi:hypothetical protein